MHPSSHCMKALLLTVIAAPTPQQSLHHSQATAAKPAPESSQTSASPSPVLAQSCAATTFAGPSTPSALSLWLLNPYPALSHPLSTSLSNSTSQASESRKWPSNVCLFLIRPLVRILWLIITYGWGMTFLANFSTHHGGGTSKVWYIRIYAISEL